MFDRTDSRSTSSSSARSIGMLGIGALPHLDLVHDERHAPLTVDTDKRVRREGVRRGGLGGLGITHQRG